MFTREMFACPCCGQNKIHKEVIDALNVAYIHYCQDFWEGVHVAVTSGYRCPKHNEEVGGGKHSLHLLGWAADTEPILKNPKNNHHLRWWAFSLAKAGFTGIGQTRRGKNGGIAIHSDLRHLLGKPPNIWAPKDNLKKYGKYIYYFGW